MDIERIVVEPVYKDDRRVGNRVWVGDIELGESDLRFRAAVCGKSWHGDTPPAVTDADTVGIVGGPAILKRAVPAPMVGPNSGADDPPAPQRSAADASALERARERISALKDRQ